MKVWVLAGLFTVITAPFAAAAETDAECQLDETRRAAEQRIDGAAAAPSTARPTVAQRDLSPAEQAVRSTVERRRNGKRIPDAELIGPRGAL
jgi:hypothetical protein